MRNERREGRVEAGGGLGVGGGGMSSVGDEMRRRSVFRADSPGWDSPSSCWKAAAIPPIRQNCLRRRCSVTTRPRNKRFRVLKCHRMSACVVFSMCAGSGGGVDGSLDDPQKPDLLVPTSCWMTAVDYSTCAQVGSATRLALVG